MLYLLIYTYVLARLVKWDQSLDQEVFVLFFQRKGKASDSKTPPKA